MSSLQAKVFLIDGLRSPFVKAGREFARIHPADLAARNIKELLLKQELTGGEINELILGNGWTLPDSLNIARVAALRAGLPKEISAFTVLRNCASSMESLVTGTAKIQAGLYDSVLAGGVESMSSTPFLFNDGLKSVFTKFLLSKTKRQKLKSLFSLRFAHLKPIISLQEGLKDPFTGEFMGETAERLAVEFSISREEQDRFALSSHKKALQARAPLKEEIFAFPTVEKYVGQDTGPRASLSLKRLAKMKACFQESCGSVTVGNSCSVNDGSSLLLLMSEDKARSLGLKALAMVKSSAFVGLEPERMGLGPVFATALALKKAGLSLKDIDLVEINEAFAAQVLACLKAFASKSFCHRRLGLPSALGEIDPQKLNVNGGALAIGHPISASGGRLILTLAKEMKRQGARFGLAALCIGGGQGGAVILERAL